MTSVARAFARRMLCLRVPRDARPGQAIAGQARLDFCDVVSVGASGSRFDTLYYVVGDGIACYNGTICDNRRRLLYDKRRNHATDASFKEVAWLKPWQLPERRSVGAFTDAWQASYFHWMLETVPQILVATQNDNVKPDALYVDMSCQFQKELLDLMGFGADRLIPANQFTIVRAHRLIVPPRWDAFENCPPWVVPLLRRAFLRSERPASRRLYVSRGDAKGRRVTNEDDLTRVLAAEGFETVLLHGRSVREQIELFSEAAIVVAPHGAALTNIAFCLPQSALIELFPPRYQPQCFEHLAKQVGMQYARVPASLSPLAMVDWSYQYADFSVDIGLVLEALGAVNRAQAGQHDA